MPKPKIIKRVKVKGATHLLTDRRLVMLTLTYADADGWNPNDIRNFMKSLKRQLEERLLAYAWVLEMQERGAPHYHVMLWLKRGTRLEMPDKSGLWKHGMSKLESAKSPFYIVKYVGKEYQKENLPKGARMFAVKIFKHTIEPEQMLPFRMSAAPVWLREAILEAAKDVGAEVRWRRAKGGGWVVVDTGEFYPSPYEVESITLIEIDDG